MQRKRFELRINEAPKSLNEGGNGSRRHWAVGYREKARWEGLYLAELMVNRVPRGMVRCTATALIRWRPVPQWGDNQDRRDIPNYSGPISKPLADSLVKAGYISDDTPDFFKMGELTFAIDSLPGCSPLVKAQLTIKLEAEYDD